MCPVPDHPVHPKTVERPNARYGCFDHPPFKDGYYAMVRKYNDDGTFCMVQEFVENKMTKDCQTSATGQAAMDRKCRSCPHIGA